MIGTNLNLGFVIFYLF
jgi:hypothetical protein